MVFKQKCNVAPTQPVPIIRQHPKKPRRDLSFVCWGLIPSWAKDTSGSAGMINARSESAATKPAFRDALKFRRCIIPADSFYEWRRAGSGKQPFCFEVNEGELFAFAGLWERLERPEWAVDQALFDPDDDTERCHFRRP
jgi:putative SOS response-associated peptidase YedK